MSTTTSESIDDGSFNTLSATLGTRTRLDLVEYLARSGPSRQVDISRAIGVTQPAVTRSKQPLLEAGVIEERDKQLVLSDEFKEPVELIIAALATYQ